MSAEKYVEIYGETDPTKLVIALPPTIIQARYFTRGRLGPIRGVTIHTAECSEVPTAAENIGHYFTQEQKDPKRRASSHYGVDCDSVVMYVAEADTAWHAGAVNGWTIGVEIAGSAGQRADGWADDYSQKTLQRAARLVAGLCSRHEIPIVRTRLEDIPNKGPGIFGHADVSAAYKVNGGHWDPGPAFDWDAFLETVRSFA